MKDLDTAIRQAFDELVDAAPPPPAAPSPTVPTYEDHRNSRLFAAAASVLIVAAVGVVALTLRDGGPNSVGTSNDSEAPGTFDSRTTVEDSVVTEPSLIREDSVSSPDPVTSVELAPFDEYEVASAPLFPETTEPVPVQGEVYDGVYFAYLHEGPFPDDPRALRFDVVQASSPQDCSERIESEGENACTDFGIDLNGSVGQLDATVDGIVVTVRDLNSPGHYRISGTELVSLVFGGQPAAPAPSGYMFSGGFGFLLTFDDGTLTRIDQPADPQPSADVSG